MKCFPVIYTRTNQCDYYADFHVLPEFVCAGNLMKYIKSATYGLDSAKNTIKKEKNILLPSRNSQASETESDAKSFQSTCFSNLECAECVVVCAKAL